MTRVDCENCTHFRTAPYEARLEGCYHPKLAGKNQKKPFNDEQMTPGNHRTLNHNHDCEKHEAKEPRLSLIQRIMTG